jgi:hypothetical protein
MSTVYWSFRPIALECSLFYLFVPGIVGYMYFDGIGIKPDLQKAFHYLNDASCRGSVFAMGQLVALYYRQRMFKDAVALATTCV